MDILSAHNSAVWTGLSWVILLLILPMAAHVDYPAGRSSGTWTWLGYWDDQASLSGPLPPHGLSQQAFQEESWTFYSQLSRVKK